MADNQVKGFIVENKKTPGFKTEKIEHKMALRVVQNALITMEDCRVPEENRLQMDLSFRDTAKVLRMTRAGVAWEAVGCMMGAYEHALAYAQQREQFGKPIGKFQLVQDLLVKMLGNYPHIDIEELKRTGKVFRENAGASIIDIRDRIGLVEFHTKANSITDDIVEMLSAAVQEGVGKFDAFVIGNRGRVVQTIDELASDAQLILNGNIKEIKNGTGTKSFTVDSRYT